LWITTAAAGCLPACLTCYINCSDEGDLSKSSVSMLLLLLLLLLLQGVCLPV
jgi:hypothetical protein